MAAYACTAGYAQLTQKHPYPLPYPRRHCMHSLCHRSRPTRPHPTPAPCLPPPFRGPLDFHRRTLANLQEATRLEQRLCGVIVGTSGREIPVVGRKTSLLESGWLLHDDTLTFSAGQKVVVTAREGVQASDGVLPIVFKEFAGGVAGVSWTGRGGHAWVDSVQMSLR